MTEETNSRLGGLVLLVLGGIALWLSQGELSAGASYSPKAAFVGPLVVAMALDFLIHAPRMPMNSLTPRDSFYMLLGTAGGVLNLDRFGFFEPGSVIRTALLGGLALAAVACLVLWLRGMTEA